VKKNLFGNVTGHVVSSSELRWINIVNI